MTQDEIIEMARKVGVDATGNEYWPFFIEELESFAKLVAQHEREVCAQVVEASPSYDWHKFACEAADAIRARGQA